MRYTLENFNAFRDACHNASVNAGWWKLAERYAGPNGEANHDPDRLTIPTKLCLVHSEISEAYDGYMTGANDDHLPQYHGALVELGDVLIRVGDLAGYLEIDLSSAIALVMQADHMDYANLTYTLRYGGDNYSNFGDWFALLHSFTNKAMESFRKGGKPDTIIPSISATDANLARVVVLCDLIARKNDWPLPAVAEAKMKYNAVRLDHKAKARNGNGGKAF